MEIIREGVRVEHFLRPFRGSFKGKAYDSDIPPTFVINNSATCARFSQFISDTIIQSVTAGVIAVWGPVDVVASPYLVLTLTVEPTKPRLCHNERYLNSWICDLPISYMICAIFRGTSFPTNSRRPSTTKMVISSLLHSSSQTYFGFRWQGFYFVFRTLPFRWKASAFICHKLGLVVLGAARSISVPLSQYIDDRHVGQLFIAPLRMTRGPSFQRALAATCIMCYLLVEAGYFIGLDKSQSTPVFTVSYVTRCVKPTVKLEASLRAAVELRSSTGGSLTTGRTASYGELSITRPLRYI